MGSARLASLLLEWARTDPVLFQRLLQAIANGVENATHLLEAPAASVAVVPEAAANSDGYMVGASPPMLRLFELIRRFAVSDAPVLIMGESGTGKELAARAIHERSQVSKGPFIAINCGALPTTLIASELFGHEKGAFTGAIGRKIGRIEAAEGGTVFLDEIGDLPPETQVHLLRFLQEKTIERLGGNKSIRVNVRVVAATNVNLREAVAKGRFREDLYYRLNVLTLDMPPLRKRGSDIMLLAKFFLQRFAKEMDRTVHGFDPAAEQALCSYAWPGNVRELIACVRRAVIMSGANTIGLEDLELSGPIGQAKPEEEAGLTQVRADAEASLVRSTLERNNFNIKRAAMALGISRPTLYRLIQRHEIRIDRNSARA
ncbi:MAG: sigma-54 dependent transcriptional regulator [Alphaproteobacteria bacterium]